MLRAVFEEAFLQGVLMLLNPSFLFPHLPPGIKGYVWIPWIPEDGRPHMQVRCGNCVSPPLFTLGPSDISLHNIIMKKDVFIKHNDQKVSIWSGICEGCKQWHWACDNWKWASWLSDFQLMKMVLPIRNVSDFNFHIEVKPCVVYFDQVGKIQGVG
jgi:hypothetical protein